MNTNKPILIVIALLVVVGVGFYVFTKEPSGTDVVINPNTSGNTGNTNTNSNLPNTPGTEDTPSVNSVMLAENKTGNFALVASVTLGRPGYVVIHRVNSNSDSVVLGHSDLLSSGAHGNLNIQLDTVVAKEQTLVAVLHEDDGDGKFEFPTSDFYLGDSTNRVVMDVDVIDVLPLDEAPFLSDQIDLFLENAAASTSPFTN